MDRTHEGSGDNREKILNAVFKALDGVNETLPREKRIEKATKTILLASEGAIDSLGLTMLIVAVEQKIEEEFGVVITLVDASTMSEEYSPFKSVDSLVTYISSLLKEKLNG